MKPQKLKTNPKVMFSPKYSHLKNDFWTFVRNLSELKMFNFPIVYNEFSKFSSKFLIKIQNPHQNPYQIPHQNPYQIPHQNNFRQVSV